MAAWIECIPNFSEGRRREVVAALLRSIHGVQGARILDRHSDADHNRTVVTMAGGPAAMEEAAFAAIACAAAQIDLTLQRGVHPRMGAADVVPFIPLGDATLEDCVSLARRLGRRVGDRLGLPVYLYEAAAARPERRRLETVRRGQYEGLKAAIRNDPNRTPDFGPAELGPAGAVAIGARGPLIAFNIYLDSQDAEIAGNIARAVRASSGGLPFLKALGLRVGGRAQVSMNLTDFTKTSLPQAFDAVRREAGRRGVDIFSSEIVGLVPAAALAGVDPAQLLIRDFTPRKILEERLKSWRMEIPAQRSVSA